MTRFVEVSASDDPPRVSPPWWLTKREYFAAKALQGYMASFAGNPKMPGPEVGAKRAVAWADALIDALSDDPK